MRISSCLTKRRLSQPRSYKKKPPTDSWQEKLPKFGTSRLKTGQFANQSICAQALKLMPDRSRQSSSRNASGQCLIAGSLPSYSGKSCDLPLLAVSFHHRRRVEDAFNYTIFVKLAIVTEQGQCSVAPFVTNKCGIIVEATTAQNEASGCVVKRLNDLIKVKVKDVLRRL